MSSGWFRGPVLPVEELLFLSDVACVGSFRCDSEHPYFRDPGEVRNHVFVFPRQSVIIEHEDARSFVAGPNVVPFYNSGQSYARKPVTSGVGVHSDWFGVAPDIVTDMARRYFPQVENRPEAPFVVPFVGSPTELFARQRRLFEALTFGERDRMHVEEEVIHILDALLRLAAGSASRLTTQRREHDYVEYVKKTLAATLDSQLSLRTLAHQAGVTVFHLCKVFRRATGFAIHQYRQELRLRRSLDEVLSSRDLLETALDLGFNSHSHFTFAFRKAFGTTPSELRKQRRFPRKHPD